MDRTRDEIVGTIARCCHEANRALCELFKGIVDAMRGWVEAGS